MKFLVVDDAAVMRKVIIRELLEMNAKEEDIVQAEDGEQALKAVKEQAFDLIFMDWNMPNMLGIDAVAAIRAAGVKTPILMVTTEGEKSNVVRAIQAGASNYLVKPFSKEGFIEKVAQLIGEISAANTDTVQLKQGVIDLGQGRIAAQ